MKLAGAVMSVALCGVVALLITGWHMGFLGVRAPVPDCPAVMTPHLGLAIIEPGAKNCIWGRQWNENLRRIDAFAGRMGVNLAAEPTVQGAPGWACVRIHPITADSSYVVLVPRAPVTVAPGARLVDTPAGVRCESEAMR